MPHLRLRAWRTTLMGAAVASLLLSGCGQATQPLARTASRGTVTFAGDPGEPPNFIFPLYPGTAWNIGDAIWFNYLMWKPLYLWGKSGNPVFNRQRSLAYAPAFSTDKAGETVATITLKPWRWSDGRPLTTRDIQFWMDLLDANKVNWGPYVPGKFPDNVKKIQYLSTRTFAITFNARYSTQWLLGNELSQITPIPQHAWDKESGTSPVGNYDRTPAGAKRVFAYLISQAKTLTTYATNPLWRVVDGAWEISAYSPTTNYVSFAPNSKYSGTTKPTLKRVIEVPFTSDTAEFNALESGQLTYGYVPFNDLNTIPALKAKGYKIIVWPQDTWGGVLFNYAPHDPQTPVLDQLYVRAAMTHLVNMRAILHVFEHGFGGYASGPVPNPTGNTPGVTSYERHDPYPYNIAAAKKLLATHGWKVNPNGVSRCQRAGTGAHDCGIGIRKGTPLSFTLLSSAQSTLTSGITQMLKSNFGLLGIDLTLKLVTATAAQAEGTACINTKTCSWQLSLDIETWPEGWTDWYPTGGEPFGCHANENFLNWCNPTSQRLINATHVNSSPSALAAYENYMAKEQPLIFLPMPVFRVSAVKRSLMGVTPQDPYLPIYPNDWHYAG